MKKNTVISALVLALSACGGGEDKGNTKGDVKPLAVNQVPIANPESNDSVSEFGIVRLTGKQSKDPDGSIKKYQWEQITDYQLGFNESDLTQPELIFYAPDVTKDSELTFNLIVTDNKGASSETASVTISITDSNANLSKLVITDGEQWLRTLLGIELGEEDTYEIIGSRTSEGALSSDSTNHKIETIENQLHLTPLTGHDEHVRYKVNGNSGVTYYDVELLNVSYDPLLEQQWHLRNTSQQNFKSYINSDDIKKGEDIKLLPAHQQGLTGEGVLVAVVDTGLELHHEDLRNNIKVDYSVN